MGTGDLLGVRVGTWLGIRVGARVGDGVGRELGGLDGAGLGGAVGTGLGAGVGEKVATSTESAVALLIERWRARRPPCAASRRRLAAVWMALVKLPSLTASSSTAITCEWTELSPALPA